MAERLTSKRLFHSASHRHEYTLLLQDRFGGLAAADREIILNWIEAGPDLERFAANHEFWSGQRPTAEDNERFADHFRLDRLWPIRNDLPDPWRRQISSLAARYGEPEDPEYPHVTRFSGATLEAHSPKTVDEFRQMSVEDIAAYLRTWQPPGGFRGPTREGLRFVLLKLVAEEPQRFAAAPSILAALPPPHLLTMLDGFREAALAGRSFSWPVVMDLCKNALTGQPDVAEPADNTYQPRDATHLLTNSIVGLLESALERHPVPIPIECREQVKEILHRLAASPDPPPDNGPANPDADPLRTAPFERPTRVKTLEAVVSYGIWVGLQLAQGQQDITLPGSLDALPEVKEILEAHLDQNRYPALGVRAFFGRSLPKIAALDAHWVECNLPLIFPAHERFAAFREAAWRGYVLSWSLPHLRVFQMLRDQYESAVDRLHPAAPHDREHDDPDRRLAQHLMTLYWHGEIDWGHGDSLIDRFFAKADDALRSEAIYFLGMSAAHEPSVPPEVLDRLRRLWEIRRNVIMEQPGHAEELAAFGWWPVSRKFDEPWAMAQLTDILARAGKAAPEFQVADWLADVAPKFPREAVRCLELIAEGSDRDFLSLFDKQATAILGAGLRDPLPETRQAARDLINRLGSRGHRQFRSLLHGHGGAQ